MPLLILFTINCKFIILTFISPLINKLSNSNVYEFIRICKVVTPKPGMGFTGPKIKNNDKRHMIAYELQIFESRTATWHPENWG